MWGNEEAWYWAGYPTVPSATRNGNAVLRPHIPPLSTLSASDGLSARLTAETLFRVATRTAIDRRHHLSRHPSRGLPW